MKLQVTQENLNKALATVSRIASSRGTLPILSNLLITAEKGNITISATNLEIAITTTLIGKVEQTGSVTVPARLMHDFVSSLPSDNIFISLDGMSLVIKTEKYTSTINGTAADEFPSLPVIANKQNIKLPVQEMKKALSQTVFAASNDEARQVLTGVYIHSVDGAAYFAATDSYRLAEKRVKTIKEDISLLVPAQTLQELARIIGDEDKDIVLSYDEAQVLFAYGDIQIISRLIDGNYPDYRQIIPKTSDITATLKKSDFMNITKISSLFAKESAGSITLHVSEEDQEISILSIASQVGENTSKAPASVTGSGEVTLNSRYLIDALNVFDSETVSFRFSGKINPCVISGADKKDDDYLHIIMPLRS